MPAPAAHWAVICDARSGDPAARGLTLPRHAVLKKAGFQEAKEKAAPFLTCAALTVVRGRNHISVTSIDKKCCFDRFY
jgi:hypothetical protein